MRRARGWPRENATRTREIPLAPLKSRSRTERRLWTARGHVRQVDYPTRWLSRRPTVRFSVIGPDSLPGKRVFARRIPLLQSLHLPVLHDELIDVISELRSPELQTLDRDKLSRRSDREYQRKTGPRLVVHFKLNFARGQVYPRELLQKLRVQGLGLAREYDFGLVQGRHCAVDISLGIRPEVDRELAILLVIRRVEPIVVEVAHRELEFVKTELKLVTFESDLENAVRRILKLASVVGQRSEEHTSELQSRLHLVCRLLLEKKKKT